MSSANFFNRAWTLVVASVFSLSGYAALQQPAHAAEDMDKVRAQVVLSNLNQTYDGAPKRAMAVTDPEGLVVIFTYNGKAAAPTKAGTYTVVGTVRDANFEGSATGTMTIAKAGQRIVFNALAEKTYGSKPFTLVATATSGLAATYESSNPAVAIVSGKSVRIAGTGTTEITAYQAGDDNFLPAEPVRQVLTVKKAQANVVLKVLRRTYDGAPQLAEAVTEPKGLTVDIAYDGSTSVPTNAGTYTVAGTVRDANYEGSTTAKMTVAKATQTITFTALAGRTYGDPPFVLAAAVSSGLSATYGSSNAAVAAVSGDNVTITGAGSAWITAYQAGDENHLPAKPVRQLLTITKATQSISFDAPVTAKYGDADFTPGAAASSGLDVSYTSSNPKVATIVEKRLHIVGAGTATITAAQAGDKNYRRAEAVAQTLTVNKAKARVFFTGLDQTYDGAPKPVGFETVPRGLAVSFTYDGNTAAPANAGAYTVIGTIQNANYEGVARTTLNVAKASQSLSFKNPVTAMYGDVDFSPAAVASSGLPVSYQCSDPKVATIVENRLHVAGAGTATITALQAGDSNYLAAEPVMQALIVNKARAKVTLSDLQQSYDGAPKSAGARTEPEGLSVTLTYDGKAPAPTNAGIYAVAATVKDANYEGSAEGGMTIAKAPQSITFEALAARTYGDMPFELSSTVSSGLTATYGSSNPAVAAVIGNRVRIVGAGTVSITAYQAGDSNYLAAEPVMQALIVNKARAKVTLSNLQQSYDGAPKSAGARTEPEGLSVTLTYEGKATAPTNAGTYTVVGAVQDVNYEGRAEGTMTVAKAPQTITFNALSVRTFGDTPFVLPSTVSSGLTATYESSSTAVATIRGSEAIIAGAGTTEITAYQAGDENYLPANPVTQSLTVKKASQTITFAALVTRTYGDMPFALTAAVSSGLTASYTSSNSAVAAVSGREVRIGNAGTAVITASQAGDSNYLAAEPVKQVLTVNKALQSITFNALPVRTYGDETPFLVFATASSGLTATYESSNKTVATIRGNEVKTAASGTTTITAYQAGDNNYLPATPVQQMLTVKKAPAWIAPLDQRYTYDGTPKPAKIATRPKGLSANITYDGNTTAPVDAGRYRVMAAVQDANYEGSATGTITIVRAPQEIKFPVLAVKSVGDGPFDLTAVLSSGLPAVYESSDPAVATISGNQVTIRGAGTATITALQAGDRNYQAAEPVMRPLIVRSQKPRIVVFPVENLSGRPAPLEEIRKSLIEALTRQGDVVLDDETMQKFMARHRVRYVGGVDTFTARAWREETGTEAVLITSLDQYEDSEVPKITLTCRIVSTGEMPYILWMENIGLSGDDTPGLFGSGLIEQIGALQSKAVRQITESLAAFYTGKKVPPRGPATESFKPKKASEIPFLDPDRTYTVAVMPFYNRSKSSKAGEVLALRFVAQLVKNKTFEVLEPGVVRQKLLNFRTVMHDGPSKADVESFFLNVGTDLILMGRILEYQEKTPKMEFEVQVYDGKRRSMVWSSWSYNQGRDAVVLFDWKRVNNAGELASNMAKSVVRDITEE